MQKKLYGEKVIYFYYCMPKFSACHFFGGMNCLAIFSMDEKLAFTSAVFNTQVKFLKKMFGLILVFYETLKAKLHKTAQKLKPSVIFCVF
jgi:hypothetical protein